MTVDMFAAGDYVVYPAHGVGQILQLETQEFSGQSLQLLVIHFDKERMTVHLPVNKAQTVGLRNLSTKDQLDVAFKALKTRRRVARTMWSRRAQEYENKINSGDPTSIAEVIRDLHSKHGGVDQAFSERQIYQVALDRLSREIAVVEKIDETAAQDKIQKLFDAA